MPAAVTISQWVKSHTSFEIRANFASSSCCKSGLVLMYECHFRFSDKHPFFSFIYLRKKKYFGAMQQKASENPHHKQDFQKTPSRLPGNNFCSFFFVGLQLPLLCATCFSCMYLATAAKRSKAKLAKLQPF